MGTLVAFPSAAVGPGDTRQTQLALIDLEGLVFHHAPSVSPAVKATANIPLVSNDPAGKGKREVFLVDQTNPLTAETMKKANSLMCLEV